MNDYTIVEKYQQKKDTTVAIRPYFNPDKENMGLESYGMSLHEGVWHEESLACLELNGIKRYVTGLNEFAPEIKKLPPGERDIKIKEIRKAVAELEAELAANILNPEDKDFWNKVTLLKPDNDKFWSKIELRCGNEPVFLDPATDPYDLIKIHAINAGGFSMISKSLKDAKKSPNPKKFYLDQSDETVSTRTEYATKLMYIAKVVDADSVQYTKSTQIDIIYENMDNFINGNGTESSKKRAAESFIEAADNAMKILKLRALVKDAMFYRFLMLKSSGFIEPLDNSIRLGKVPSEVVSFLKSPENDEILKSLMEKVEPYWNA